MNPIPLMHAYEDVFTLFLLVNWKYNRRFFYSHYNPAYSFS